MRRVLLVMGAASLLIASLAVPSQGRDRPFNTSRLSAIKLMPAPEKYDLPGLNGGQFSKKQIEKFTCEGNEAGADPTVGEWVDISCNTEEYGQDFAPDNEIAIAANPVDPLHLVAGSNDYYYRFNNATGARQALVPTGFFTSFDGGQTWTDGQVPFGSGNGSGDPAPAFDAKHDVVVMAQLQNVAGVGGFWVAAGNIGVSRSLDGGLTWERPVVVMKGKGAGIGPANNAVFWDKEYITVDNYQDSPFFGRIYVTATKFVNGVQGSYVESPIFLSYSDDGGVTWSEPAEVSGSHPSCTFQSAPPFDTDCDEDQFGYPAVAPDGTLYVHFHNYQNVAAWDEDADGNVDDLFDAQVMVVKSTDGGEIFSSPVQVAQLEDGLADMPYSVIFRQTIWGHQIRWTSAGNISVSPDDPNDLAIVWSERAAANPNASLECLDAVPGTAPDYDPCAAGGPDAVTQVYMSTSSDGGATWTSRQIVEGSDGSQWFPWAGHLSDGTLAVAWDEDQDPDEDGKADVFKHVLSVGGGGEQILGPEENIDVSVTHWAGQYTTAWPEVCGPAGSDTPGKGCNVFHGDYTGLAVGPDDTIHVVWTGLNQEATSPQIDFYTGEPRTGYRQDAMYAQVSP